MGLLDFWRLGAFLGVGVLVLQHFEDVPDKHPLLNSAYVGTLSAFVGKMHVGKVYPCRHYGESSLFDWVCKVWYQYPYADVVSLCAYLQYLGPFRQAQCMRLL